MIVLGQSDGFNSRKLVSNQDSSLSSPPPADKKPNLSSVEAPKANESPDKSPSNVESKDLNDTNTKKSSENSGDLELDQGKNQDGIESKTFATKSCKGLPVCSDQGKSMIACIQDFVNGSNKLSLVVQNEKDVDLKVNITFGTSVNNNLLPFKIPAHGTTEVNITFSGDKSNKVILYAGNGVCELQISQPLTTLVNSPSKPKDASNPVDTPAKPKDANNPVESPTKPKEGNIPSKSKDVNTPSKSKDVNDLPKSKDVDDPSKSKSKDIDNPSKTKEVNDPSKLKDNEDPSKSKSKDVEDPSKSKSKDVDDLSKSKDTSVDTSVSQNNFLDQLTFYSKQVTPIYGAYLAFLVTLIIGGSWALCTFRKRRTGKGVPYQELEMGPTEPSNAGDVETAEGWDHDWNDDDWDDEDKAIKSPGGGVQTKSISSNGLTSRATKKDGWDADWDD
ncbi:hypothetical protein L1987_63785 [Smallanthus sonchifolius]|uniref:Uncharacterized protein n=1 Tax=Smallanthus sonchifolius TaxID=185202 RepID=A0ACB9CE70_9ASTR|nr:hypothetical protein L1987_63785 [Smallanthus sonchifolius]